VPGELLTKYGHGQKVFFFKFSLFVFYFIIFFLLLSKEGVKRLQRGSALFERVFVATMPFRQESSSSFQYPEAFQTQNLLGAEDPQRYR